MTAAVVEGLAYLPTLNRQDALLAILGGLLVVLSLAIGNESGPAEAITAGVILLAQRGVSLPWLERGPLAYLGRLSYGLYLWHYPLLWVANTSNIWDTPSRVALSLGGGLIAAAVSYHTVETWFRATHAPRQGVARAAES